MKTTLSPQLRQHIHLTPSLLQSIGLLQLNGLQLEQQVRQMLESNPLLELEEVSSPSIEDTPPEIAQLETAALDELPEGMLWDAVATGFHDAEEDACTRLAAPQSTDPHLRILQDLAFELEPDALEIAAFWLEYCDESGYLTESLAELYARGSTRFSCDPKRMEAIRHHLLHGEPLGIAASSLHECLHVQLLALPASVAGRTLALALLADLEQLARHDYSALAARHAVEVDEVRQGLRLIMSLQPRPMQVFLAENNTAIIPDVVTWQADGQWRVALNRQTAPRVCLNPLYERALAENAEHTNETMRTLLHQARWFSRGLATRHDTLLRAARIIVERQAAFLAHGEEALAPLTLKEVADSIDMHESTISRITSGKYLQTPRGTFELKYFFAVRLEGANLSGAAIKARVRRLIESEPPTRPLADETIAAVLAQQGVCIARRTVTKYREQLGISGARLRRRQHTLQLKTA